MILTDKVPTCLSQGACQVNSNNKSNSVELWDEWTSARVHDTKRCCFKKNSWIEYVTNQWGQKVKKLFILPVWIAKEETERVGRNIMLFIADKT